MSGRFVVHVKHQRRAAERGVLPISPKLFPACIILVLFILFFVTGGLLGYVSYHGLETHQTGSKIISTSEGKPGRAVCANTCNQANNGVCNEGRQLPFKNSSSPHSLVTCDLGTDCADCGPWTGGQIPKHAAADGGSTAGPIAVLQSEGLEVRTRNTTTSIPFQIAYGDPQLDRGMSDALQASGMYEGGNSLLVHKMLSSRCVQANGKRALVLDVGAGFGYFSLLAASYGCRVIAWEPVPTLRAYFTYGVLVNGFSHLVEIRPSAVGINHSSNVHMVVPQKEMWGAASVDDMANSDTSQVTGDTVVSMEAVDTVVQEPVLLMKVDVSGYEQPVLTSAATLLQKHGVQHILMDYNPGVAEQRLTTLPNAHHKAAVKANPAGLLRLLDLGYAMVQMPDHWAKSGTVDYTAQIKGHQWLAEVTARHLAFDVADTERFVAGTLGCPTLPELIAANAGSWSRCNLLPADAHPKSLRSAFGYNTNLWMSKDRQLMQPGSSVGLFALDQDMRHWVSLQTPQRGIGGVSCAHIPVSSIVRSRCKCRQSACSEEQRVLIRLTGQGRVAGADNEGPLIGAAASA